jgi:hypothetical protein
MASATRSMARMGAAVKDADAQLWIGTVEVDETCTGGKLRIGPRSTA